MSDGNCDHDADGDDVSQSPNRVQLRCVPGKIEPGLCGCGLSQSPNRVQLRCVEGTLLSTQGVILYVSIP